MNRRFELTDQEWERLAPLLPVMTPQRGGRWRDHRQVLNGILFRVRTGVPWRDLPARYGPWETVYKRFARWQTDGTWAHRSADRAPGPQRHLVPGPHRGALARPARAVWALGDGLQAVRALAARRHLGPHRGHVAAPGRRGS